MKKIIVGPKAKGCIDLNKSVEENIKSVANALGKKTTQMTIITQDRDRHDYIVQAARNLGCRIKMFGDGDVAAGIATCFEETGIDMLMGIGGGPEGVITAAAIKCMGGDMQGQIYPLSEQERNRCHEMGFSDKDIEIRNYDEHSEKIVSQFLQKYFYPSLNPTSIEIVDDKCRQVKGIDIILNLNNKIYTIDEKTTVRYVKLPTFSLELEFINRNNKLQQGWLLDNSKINDYYLFAWLEELNDPIIVNIDSIKSMDVAIVNKNNIINYLNSLGWTKDNLQKKTNKIRSNPNENLGNFKDNGCKFSISNNLREKPINVLLKKTTYKEIADIYKNIRLNYATHI